MLNTFIALEGRMSVKNIKFLLAELLLIILAVIPAVAQISTADTAAGRVEGVVKDEIASFKGIPFAAPPTGDLRWRPPQTVQPWKGLRKAFDFAPGCMQDTAFGASLGGPQAISEDCLYLNIWTGARKADEKRPVMVWIYGGGFGIGMTSTPLYDGANLARKGVVLVSLAYRLGPLGFLAHPELSKESGKGSGCYGIQDLVAGLKWVKKNIARFGGDPSNITIFGESAGGKAVGFLVTSPAARGLFQRAISESGGAAAPPVRTLREAEAQGAAYLKKLGAEDIKTARALSAAQIQSITKGMGDFKPVPDGRTVVEDPYLLFETGKFNKTPILVGTNSDEGGLFVTQKITSATFEDYVQKKVGPGTEEILKAYPHSTDAEAARSAKDIYRESSFAWPTWTWARLQSKRVRDGVFVYYFDRRTPTSPEGSSHAAELAFVFDNLGKTGRPGASIKPEDKALSELMTSYWINFAKNGNPNGPGLPIWPAFDEKEQQTMFFDQTPGARPHPNVDKIKAFDVHFAKIGEMVGVK
jgi:para-nitrobenzyl esterase